MLKLRCQDQLWEAMSEDRQKGMAWDPAPQHKSEKSQWLAGDGWGRWKAGVSLELLGLGPEVKAGPRPCVFVEDGFWKHLPGLFSCCPVDTQATEPCRLWGWQAQDVGESLRSQEGRGWSSWKPPPLGLQGTAVRRPAALWTEGSLPSGRPGEHSIEARWITLSHICLVSYSS